MCSQCILGQSKGQRRTKTNVYLSVKSKIIKEKILYLIPSPIVENQTHNIPAKTIEIIHSCRSYIAERARTTRRYIKSTHPPYRIDELAIEEMDKHNQYALTPAMKSLIQTSNIVGLITEAGLPCIADPGEEVVTYARTQGYEIRPLVGPSSIMLALMASGLNGEQFTFHGYLPQDKQKLRTQLQMIEKKISDTGYSQIWIETPYRNAKLMEQIVQILPDKVNLCIAMNILSPIEKIVTLPIKKWKELGWNWNKSPAIFVAGK